MSCSRFWRRAGRLLLGNAMDVAAAQEYLPRVQADDFVPREQFRQFAPRAVVVAVLELWQNDAAVRNVEINV